YCWGEAWGDDTLAPRERSILNLGMIASLGKMEEFQTHVRGALRNGLTPNEIRAVLTQIAVYCGVPVGVDCFRTAKAVLNEGKKPGRGWQARWNSPKSLNRGKFHQSGFIKRLVIFFRLWS